METGEPMGGETRKKAGLHTGGDRSDAAEDRKQDDGRDLFERLVEHAQQIVSHAPFFLLCVLIIVAWAASYPLFHDTKLWMSTIHTVSSVLSLLLLVLLENSGRRADEAAQEKLNVLAEGLSALMDSQVQVRHDPELEDAVQKLRDAVGLEARH